MELGLRYIARRLRFESEVRTHLRGKGVRGAQLDGALDRLRELGMVSDFETCRAWIRDRLHFSPKSRRALRVQLLRKGAEEEAVDRALDDVLAGVSDVDLAVRALQRPVKRLRSVPEPVARRRMWAALGRHGFDPDVTREAIARVTFDAEDAE